MQLKFELMIFARFDFAEPVTNVIIASGYIENR